MNRYLIEYESSQWCGGVSHCVVYANSENEAEDRASEHMETTMRELFGDEYENADGEYEEEQDYDDECAYSVIAMSILDESNDHWGFYQDPTQSSFYPEVNTND